MKETNPQERISFIRERVLLGNALQGAAASGGYWLNASGRPIPRFHPKGPSVSPYNALILGMHADQNGYPTGLYLPFNEAKRQGESVLQHEQGVPFHWYKWEKYVNRHDPNDTLSREDYLHLLEEQQKQYKGVRNREVQTLFNLAQTTLPMSDPDTYKFLTQQYGGFNERGNLKAEERQRHTIVNRFVDQIKVNLVSIRKDAAGLPRYDTTKDAVYMPDQKHFQNYEEYVQELFRQVASATGHQQRLAREGMIMQGGQAPSEKALKYERLVTEIASGVKMMEVGMPAKLSKESLGLVEYWMRELEENPNLLEALETDVNNAVNVMRKAEDGEKIEYATLRNRQRISELWEKQKPQVDSRECVVLLDIIRKGGMAIDDRNFISPEEKQAFLEKFSLGYYEKGVNEALSRVHDEDQEIVDLAYTEALSYGAQIASACEEYMPLQWNMKGTYFVADRLKDLPERSTKEMVVVRDSQTGIADVVLPAGAMEGGHVVLPDGDKRPFRISPDEVMNSKERTERQARVVGHNLPGFSKQRIENALRADGASYVRFFNKDGMLGYRPDDSYFEGKKIYTALLDGKKLRPQSQIDVSNAVNKAVKIQFDRIQMLKNDDGNWVLYLQPQGEQPFCIHPSKEDLNRFFSTIKQKDQTASGEIRQELAHKYYALAQNQPNLKTDLFGGSKADTDLSRIQRVNVFRTRDGRFLCSASIEGINQVTPREITTAQWQRMWVAENMSEYKTGLAARLFADLLQQHEKVEETIREEQDTKNKLEQGSDNKAKPLNELQPFMEYIDSIKAKHPDTMILLRDKDVYRLYREDAEKAENILGITKSEHDNLGNGEKIGVASLPFSGLDAYLAKLIRAGQRVAICDQPDLPQITHEQEQRTGIRR